MSKPKTGAKWRQVTVMRRGPYDANRKVSRIQEKRKMLHP